MVSSTHMCQTLLIMVCPFIDVVVDEGAIIIRRAFQRERIFRDRSDPLAFPDVNLHEPYRFSRKGIAYICRLLSPHIANSTHRNKGLTVPQTVCIAFTLHQWNIFVHSWSMLLCTDYTPVFKKKKKKLLGVLGSLPSLATE